jgi:ankyrin repeat protein
MSDRPRLELEAELRGAIRRRQTLDAIRSIVDRRRPQQSVRNPIPLLAALICGSPLEVVQFVFECYPGAVCARSGRDRDLPLHVVGLPTPPECVAFLIDRYPEALAARNMRGYLPLHTAINRHAGRRVIQMLVEGRPQSLAEFDPVTRPEGMPRLLPIHVAAMTPGPHHLDVVRYLVGVAPMSVRGRTPPDWGDGRTRSCLPLHLALRVDVDPAVIHVLLQQWPESARERSDAGLPLDLALNAIVPSEEVVQILLDAYPEAIQVTNARGSTPVHGYLKDGFASAQLLRLLIDCWPEALLVADAEGDLPIHVALRTGMSAWELQRLETTARLLSERCPESLRVANAKGQRPVHLAIVQDNVPVVRILADLAPEVLQEADAGGTSPAHLVASCEYASADLARCVAEAWPESLLTTNQNGDTPLHVAIDRAFPSSEPLAVFLERCPEALRVANSSGRSPLFVAIARNHGTVARLVVEADPESARHVDSRRRTAAHFAASRERLSSDLLLQFLAETWPAALQMRDVEGNVPLFVAAENESMDLNAVFFLLRAWPGVAVGSRPSFCDNAATRGKRRRSPSMG